MWIEISIQNEAQDGDNHFKHIKVRKGRVQIAEFRDKA